MRRSAASVLLAFLALAATACGRAGEGGDEAHDTTAAGTPHAAPPGAEAAAEERGPDDHATDAHDAAGHATAAGEGQALLPIMQHLGSEMTALTHALMRDDLETVTRRAAAIAEHAPISAAELERVRATLGADMAAFEAVDESVHVASVRLHEAARARQPGLVVERLGDVQRGCVSCHAQFRERLRTGGGAR